MFDLFCHTWYNFKVFKQSSFKWSSILAKQRYTKSHWHSVHDLDASDIQEEGCPKGVLVEDNRIQKIQYEYNSVVCSCDFILQLLSCTIYVDALSICWDIQYPNIYCIYTQYIQFKWVNLYLTILTYVDHLGLINWIVAPKLV